jgi:hypothetical protein
MMIARSFVLGCAVFLAACGGDKTDAPKSQPSIPESFILKAAPQGAVTPTQVREAGTIGDVVVTGRIGGDKVVFVNNRAVFTLVDPSLEPCPTAEGCPTPWDFCCADPDEIKSKSVTVELHDEKGILKSSIQGFHGIDHLKTIVAQGKLSRDAGGNQVLVATGLFVQP